MLSSLLSSFRWVFSVLPHLGHEIVISSTDVCAVSLKYIGSILLDWSVKYCFWRVASYFVTVQLDTVLSLDLCLQTAAGTVVCTVSPDRSDAFTDDTSSQRGYVSCASHRTSPLVCVQLFELTRHSSWPVVTFAVWALAMRIHCLL